MAGRTEESIVSLRVAFLLVTFIGSVDRGSQRFKTKKRLQVVYKLLIVIPVFWGR